MRLDVDAFGGEALEGAIAEVVGPERGDEHDRGTGARRRDGLVRAFAAGGDLEAVTKTVSPGAGILGTLTVISVFELPTTTTLPTRLLGPEGCARRIVDSAVL